MSGLPTVRSREAGGRLHVGMEWWSRYKPSRSRKNTASQGLHERTHHRIWRPPVTRWQTKSMVGAQGGGSRPRPGPRAVPGWGRGLRDRSQLHRLSALDPPPLGRDAAGSSSRRPPLPQAGPDPPQARGRHGQGGRRPDCRAPSSLWLAVLSGDAMAGFDQHRSATMVGDGLRWRGKERAPARLGHGDLASSDTYSQRVRGTPPVCDWQAAVLGRRWGRAPLPIARTGSGAFTPSQMELPPEDVAQKRAGWSQQARKESTTLAIGVGSDAVGPGQSSVADSRVMGTPASALETGQDAFASSAARWKAA